MTNLIQLEITAEEQTQISEAFATIETLLLPKLKTLTVDERKELLKMGDKSFAFTTKALDYTKQQPEFAPAFMDVNDFKIDLEAVNSLRPIQNKIAKIANAVDDSLMISGSEAYSAALMYYNNVKMGAKSNIPGAKGIYDDLKARFPGKRN
ncbi:hypothetical protein [Saccharicrinis aurantiacus]|uniref:hypothetical protein n=1 Tax=Saccharicrinis aurantiacus TaxID=1849719 RepID=UPI0009500472|nr:hypothetical protein [Saccharicrinis aurantiacus]